MKPVDQTITGDEGDCFRACIASILELPVLEVPHFLVESDDMQGAAKVWLAERGYLFLPVYFVNPDSLQYTGFGFYDYCILGGYSPRRNERGDHRQHAVVARLLPWGVKIVHDPHPDKSGLLNWGQRWIYIVASLETEQRRVDQEAGEL